MFFELQNSLVKMESKKANHDADVLWNCIEGFLKKKICIFNIIGTMDGQTAVPFRENNEQPFGS